MATNDTKMSSNCDRKIPEAKSEGFIFCRLLLKICPKGPNFICFFEEKKADPPPPLPTPIRKPAILRGCEWEMERSTGQSLPLQNDLFWTYEPPPKRASKVYLLRAESGFRKR